MSRRRSLCFLCAVTLFALAAVAHGQGAPAEDPSAASLPPNPTRLLVKVRPGRTAEEVAAAHARVGARLVRDLPQIGWQVVAVAHGQHERVRELYGHEPAFERADFDHARKLAYTPNDPYWPYQWDLVNMQVDTAWDTVKGDPGVVVAVMDTGLDTGHEDLVANVWVNPGEIAGNGIDDEGNGYVDDVNGYDFAYGDAVPDDVYGHGTACAGIVAATQDNGLGMSGIAPGCRLAGIKAALDSGYFYDSANVPAFLYCADMGFKVITMSFFADDVTPAERDAVDYCWKKGMVLVAAAGNDSSVLPYYPGAYEHVIAVAATDGGNNRAWFSNYGSWVDVAAPGVGVTATWPGNGYTTGFAGTSAATPHVAGVAALLFSAKSDASNQEVWRALEDTAIPVTDLFLGEYVSYGRVQAQDALDRLLGATSGSKPARLLFAAPVGGDPLLLGHQRLPKRRPFVQCYGVGFEPPNAVRVLRDGQPQLLLAQQRQWVDAALVPQSGPQSGTPPTALYELEVNGTIVGGFTWDFGPGLVYAPSDLGTFGATVTGGFPQIHRVDGDLLTCDDNGGGAIYVQVAVRKVRPHRPGKFTLEFTRAYDDCTGGTETIALYDWSTWSYPYGSWLTLSSTAIPDNAMGQVTASITVDPERYIDDEGTMYFYVYTSGAAANGLLRADAFNVRVE